MKNKKVFLIIGLIIIAIIISILLFTISSKSYRGELSNEDKQIIAESAYSNYAWGFQYRGKALFSDGTIYKWDFDGSFSDYNVSTPEDHKNWILEHGTKVNKVVSEKDLTEIEDAISKLDGTIEKENTAYDAGSNYIAVWKDGEMTKLSESGDFTGENKDISAQRLIKLINKHLK